MSQLDFKLDFATTSETAAALREKRISARELLTMTYQRIDRHTIEFAAALSDAIGGLTVPPAFGD
jgi:Asp-tRNA(Asn)/Glu-tRNA(Gln) amidotransferase A subunit family amidase